MVTGCTGYVANFIIIELAKKYPMLEIIGMSRQGKARTPEIMHRYHNVSYVKGNCLEPSTYKDLVQDVDGCIHTVGTLIDNKKKPHLSYSAMNRDTAIFTAKELNLSASPDKKKTFVYLSSAKPPPFLEEYITSKIEAEQYLFN